MTDVPKVAVVTGVSQGFGKAIAQELVQCGWHVVGDARSAHQLHEVAKELGPQLHPMPGDVQQEQHLTQLVDKAAETGQFELLVNNAGSLGPSPLPRLADVEIKAVDTLFDVNVLAPLRLIQLSIPQLARGGVVINISSDAGVEVYEGWGAYGASKAALDLFTGVLAAENPELLFYALDPGDMQTPMHQLAYPGEDISDRPSPSASAPAVIALSEGTYPSGRYSASDLAPVGG